MAIEKRRTKVKAKRRDKSRNDADPTKEEYAVAKFVRFNCPTKKANIMGNDLPYFTACKAIDCLMSSKFAGDGEKKLFSNRHACVAYMQTLMDKGLFFRAKKLVPKTSKDIKQLVAESVKDKDQTAAAKKRKKEDDAQKKTAADEVVSEKDAKKKSKKVKFDVHQNQVFNDGNDIHVWKYDPTSTKMFFFGLAMVIGAIGVCLFPLWPLEVRLGVYYLSIAAMGFVGVIIALVILRMVVFASVWLCTLGRHHFWLLPHLTDDCGFFESFQPLYTHTRMQGKTRKASGEPEDDGQPENNKSKIEEIAKSSGNDLEEEEDDEEEEEGEADEQGSAAEDQPDSSAAEEDAEDTRSFLPKSKHRKKLD